MEKKDIKEQMTTNPDELSHVVTLLERIKRFINREGLKGTLTSLLTLFIAAMVAFFVFNPGAFFEKFEEYSTEKHENAIKYRMEVDPEIRAYLSDMKGELHANRTYVLEAHNGGSNLSNLPFLYTDLTYMVPRTPHTILESEYKNFRLSRFPWATYVVDNGFWFGPIEDVIEEDPELYYKLKKEEVTHMGMILLHGKSGLPTGCLGVVYTQNEEVLDERYINRVMQKYSNIISPLLINNNITKR